MTTKYLDTTPGSYVGWMTDDPGLKGDFPGTVCLDQYLCAVGEYGGNKNALEMRTAILQIAKAKGRKIVEEIGSSDFERIFTGQGKPEHQLKVMNFIWEFKEEFTNFRGPKNDFPFENFFVWRDTNPFNRMVDKKYFGLDCIGFVGRYFQMQKVFDTYPSLYPRQYLDRFLPVNSLEDVRAGCVLVWVKGTHIAIIDTVYAGNPGPGMITVDICQSSSGEARGPQLNKGVILQQTSNVEYIDFGGYGKAVDGKKKSEAELTQLRKDFTKVGGATGYRGGIFLKVFHAGTPAAPVGGNVYVGCMRDLKFFWED